MLRSPEASRTPGSSGFFAPKTPLRMTKKLNLRCTKGYYAALLYRLALAELALGNRASALQHATEALEWFTRLGMKPDVPAAQALVASLTNS